MSKFIAFEVQVAFASQRLRQQAYAHVLAPGPPKDKKDNTPYHLV